MTESQLVQNASGTLKLALPYTESCKTCLKGEAEHLDLCIYDDVLAERTQLASIIRMLNEHLCLFKHLSKQKVLEERKAKGVLSPSDNFQYENLIDDCIVESKSLVLVLESGKPNAKEAKE